MTKVDNLLCCEWCGDEFPINRMETLGLCAECYVVADEVSDDALLPLPAAQGDGE